MPYVRDAHTRPVSCAEHVWQDFAGLRRCHLCRIIWDTREYGALLRGSLRGVAIGSPMTQPVKLRDVSGLKAGATPSYVPKDAVEARLRGALNGRESLNSRRMAGKL